ncbi:MAG TPA: M28 family peptidase [Bacteroidales bacterium]|nr:M28 family peptidase [Bacteroidales bacterium]HPT20713.1 M28 family peptidase [Bacteroidales bacterium]
MTNDLLKLRVISFMLFFTSFGCSFSQSRGLKAITEKELRYHLDFLGAREFRGREIPSPELEIATLYIGNWAKNEGLKPIMKDGSFYQTIPVTVTSVFQPNTKISISKGIGEHVYYYDKAFGGNFSTSGSYSGDVVFAGLGYSDQENGWDDLKDLDLKGKIVVILDAERPGTGHNLGVTIYNRLNSRIAEIKKRGASALFTIVSAEREAEMAAGQKIFENIPDGRMGVLFDSQRTEFTDNAADQPKSETRPYLPFGQAEISHELAADLLGISKGEIGEMFDMAKNGKQIPSYSISAVHVRLDVEVETYKSTSRNVIAVVEGSDPALKDEYVVICGHHDALGIRDGEIIPGADDNGTATVALMEIGQALLAERPKRSVILAWFTGEERGMNGSHYFINNCPVPVEKISTCLDMDMIGRNDPDSLFLVGSNLLSSELDGAINRVNKRSGINFKFDYRYSDVSHPSSVYFRSDHYPFIRFGIPSVWFFCGFTFDYHTPKDVLEYIDYNKFCRTTRLVYLTALEIGNMNKLLKLDVNPDVTSRGKHNLREVSLFKKAIK